MLHRQHRARVDEAARRRRRPRRSRSAPTSERAEQASQQLTRPPTRRPPAARRRPDPRRDHRRLSAFEAPLKPSRRRRSCSPVITAFAATRADDQAGDARAACRGRSLTMMSTTMFSAARRVGIHGRCTAKKVRVSSRLMPAERQAEGEPEERDRDEVRRLGVELAALEEQPHDRCREHDQERRRGDQQQVDLAHADPDARGACRATSRLAAMRLSVGNSTVATATLNSPCGSM